MSEAGGAAPQPLQAGVEPAPAEIPFVYTIDGLEHELRQAEIITNLAQFLFDPVTTDVDSPVHPFVLVLSQDCDLLWDYTAMRKDEPGELNGILIYEAEPIDAARGKIKGADIWKRIISNRDERYHFLEAVPDAVDLLHQGLPALVIDFKRYFTLPVKEVYRQIGLANGDAAKRRCRLEMPYREHLQCRLAFYLQRVVLPLPHQT